MTTSTGWYSNLQILTGVTESLLRYGQKAGLPEDDGSIPILTLNPGAYGQSPEHGKVVQCFRSVSRARTNSQRLGIVQGVLALSPGWTWLSPLV